VIADSPVSSASAGVPRTNFDGRGSRAHLVNWETDADHGADEVGVAKCVGGAPDGLFGDIRIMRKSERKIGPYMENPYRAEYQWQVEDSDACQEPHILPDHRVAFTAILASTKALKNPTEKVAQLTPIAPDPNSAPKFVFGLVQSINHPEMRSWTR